MGIPVQEHKPIKGSRAIEHEKHKARILQRKGLEPRVGSRPKNEHETPIHGGMTDQQRAGAGLGGQGHAVAVVSGGQKIASSIGAVPTKDGSVNLQPLPHAYGKGIEDGLPHPKLRGPVPTYPGMRSRVNSSHPNDQAVAKGLNGHLPQVVSSKT